MGADSTEVLGLSFLCNDAEVIRVHDAICWRHVQGRTCYSKSQKNFRLQTSAAIIPIPPRAPSPAGCSEDDALHAEQVELKPLLLRITDYCYAIRGKLATAGLAAVVDDDFKQTPGAKFFKWEHLQVNLRLDIGREELLHQTAALCLPAQLYDSASSNLPAPSYPVYKRKGRVTIKGILLHEVAGICKQYLQHADGLGNEHCGKLHLWPGQPVCYPNLKHLMGHGGQCRCSAPHKSLAELREEVETLFHQCGQQVQGWLNDSTQDAASDRHVTVFVGGLPQELALDEVKAALWAGLQPFGVARVKAAKGHLGLSRGWAYAYFPDEPSACTLLQQTGGTLDILGHPASLSRATGRADTLFPHLPAPIRSQIRIDSVAAYSVTDQYTADLITSLVACLASAVLHPSTPEAAAPSHQHAPCLGAAHTPATSATPSPTQMHSNAATASPTPQTRPAGTQLASSPPVPSTTQPDPRPDTTIPPLPFTDSCATGLLPCTITDGTACCGGNTISFLRRFSRVHAVEIDEDRCDDLRHNLTLIMQQQQQQQQQQPMERSRAAHVPQREHELPEYLAGVRSDAERNCCNTSASSRSSAGAHPAVPGSPCEVGSVWGEGVVHNEDYTKIFDQIQQEVVFLDPPWGGPQYRQHGQTDDLPLGDTTLVALLRELARQCRLCCLRLPKTVDMPRFVQGVLGGLGTGREVQHGTAGQGVSSPVANIAVQMDLAEIACGGSMYGADQVKAVDAVAAQIPFGAGRVVVFAFADVGGIGGVHTAMCGALKAWWKGPGKSHRPWVFDASTGAFVKLEHQQRQRQRQRGAVPAQ